MSSSQRRAQILPFAGPKPKCELFDSLPPPTVQVVKLFALFFSPAGGDESFPLFYFFCDESDSMLHGPAFWTWGAASPPVSRIFLGTILSFFPQLAISGLPLRAYIQILFSPHQIGFFVSSLDAGAWPSPNAVGFPFIHRCGRRQAVPVEAFSLSFPATLVSLPWAMLRRYVPLSECVTDPLRLVAPRLFFRCVFGFTFSSFIKNPLPPSFSTALLPLFRNFPPGIFR